MLSSAGLYCLVVFEAVRFITVELVSMETLKVSNSLLFKMDSSDGDDDDG